MVRQLQGAGPVNKRCGLTIQQVGKWWTHLQAHERLRCLKHILMHAHTTGLFPTGV